MSNARNRAAVFEVIPGQIGNVRAAIVFLAVLPAARLRGAVTADGSNGQRVFLKDEAQYHKHHRPLDAATYKRLNLIKRMFYRLKDVCRMSTSDGELARKFEASVALPSVIVCWP